MIEIIEYKHSDSLMRTLSCFAMDKKVFDELGYPVYSDKNHTWYIMYWSGKIAGFCASIKKNGYTSFNHDYIVPEFRKQGVYRSLFKYRMYRTIGKIKAVATNKSLKTFLNHGFDLVKKTKNYTFVEKTI